MLRSGCIHLPREATDDICISVMSRHTLNDGVTPDIRINPESLDAWWKELAPPPKLIGAYYKRGLPWMEFEEAYRAHLRTPLAGDRLTLLTKLSQRRNVAILCVEPTPEKCHRRLILEAVVAVDPKVAVWLG